MWKIVVQQTSKMVRRLIYSLISGNAQVPKEIHQDVAKTLEGIGQEIWPESYEVVRLSNTVWGLQPRNFATPPIGRYEVEVVFMMDSPSHFAIRHANKVISASILNFASTTTIGVSSKELELVLHEINKKYGPMHIRLPFK